MRAIGAAPVALLGAAALALTAPAATAYAATSGGASSATGYTVTPSVIVPGSQVILAARGCSTTATAGSGVFDTVTIPRGAAVATTVDRDAKPGAAYEVTFICNTSPGSTAKAGLTVRAASDAPATSTPASPAGVQGGLGGSVDRMNAAEIAAGTALAVVTATGTIYVIRERKGSRPH
ncbi:hypothetical protein OG609_03430 [Streptomyces sp. NBC_01224]|uniref:hypothetical protein n=1 Tax=Streptomyces sp. NBC_01224 TaxID=2903783 RepID=UPI002E0D1139|nr:hypothetical protein OG609_03430 [Streptomyces sp. NBC_01224]